MDKKQKYNSRNPRNLIRVFLIFLSRMENNSGMEDQSQTLSEGEPSMSLSNKVKRFTQQVIELHGEITHIKSLSKPIQKGKVISEYVTPDKSSFMGQLNAPYTLR